MTTRSTITTNVTRLLDFLLQSRQLKNDAALSRLLQVQAPVISKLRYDRMNLSDAMILRIHERAGMSVAQIREFLNSVEAI
jgi:plasmid maintenance system antidote protein VapI